MGTQGGVSIEIDGAEVQAPLPKASNHLVLTGFADSGSVSPNRVQGATGIPSLKENVRGFAPGLGSGLTSPLNLRQPPYGRPSNPIISVDMEDQTAYEGMLGAAFIHRRYDEVYEYNIDQLDPSVLYLGWSAIERVGVLPSKLWLPSVIERFQELRQLKRGWDSRSSEPVKESGFGRVIDFLSQVMLDFTPPPSIVPLGTGGLQIEWHRAGLNVEIEFDDETTPIYVHVLASGVEVEEKDPIALFQRLKLSSRLAAGYDPAYGRRR